MERDVVTYCVTSDDMGDFVCQDSSKFIDLVH